MALADTGIYLWVIDAIHPALGNGKITAAPTWKLYLLQSGGYTPSFAGHEAFSVVSGGVIVASKTVAPSFFANGKALIVNVDFPLLVGATVGGVALTVSGTIERLYAHWGKANAGLPFTPDGSTKVLTNLTLEHATVIV